MTDRYVALGSSMAAGPGIAPRVSGSPRLAGRSARNYPHLVAERRGLDLVDVTYSGATTAHILSDSQNGSPPQIQALDGSETLVTVTIGGNDVGYVPFLAAASLPGLLHKLPFLGRPLREILNEENRFRALGEVASALRQVADEVRVRSPRARVMFVDYLTLLPSDDDAAPPLTGGDVETGRRIAAELASATARAAADAGCEIVSAAAASIEHHAWSAEPWTTRPGLPLPGRVLPLHPNAAGMRAVADLIVRALEND